MRPLRESDLGAKYLSWFENEQVSEHNSHGVLPLSAAEISGFVKKMNSKSDVTWGIFHAQDGHIGNITLDVSSWVYRVGQISLIIGDSNHWNRGVGSLVCRQVVRHAFEKMDLEKVWISTTASNKGMIRVAESLGFEREGTLREHLFLRNRRVDAVIFGLLKRENLGP